MKHLTTLLTMGITLTGLGQQMPYNPDANGDDFVGVDDVLGVLGVYDTALIQSDLTCDYEGTGFENWITQLFEQQITLDSLYVEYLIIDSSQIFVPGCPEPQDVVTVLDRSYVFDMINWNDNAGTLVVSGSKDYLGWTRGFGIIFFGNNGTYRIELQDYEVSDLTSLGYQSSWSYDPAQCCAIDTPLPFPEDWTLTVDGIEVGWTASSYVGQAINFRLIPFWHETE